MNINYTKKENKSSYSQAAEAGCSRKGDRPLQRSGAVNGAPRIKRGRRRSVEAFLEIVDSIPSRRRPAAEWSEPRELLSWREEDGFSRSAAASSNSRSASDTSRHSLHPSDSEVPIMSLCFALIVALARSICDDWLVWYMLLPVMFMICPAMPCFS